jgi:hypothetical protein
MSRVQIPSVTLALDLHVRTLKPKSVTYTPHKSFMKVPLELLGQARSWPTLKRWERRALGQALRELGLSYREIGHIIPVPKGTLSAWCRDIRLSPEQQARLKALTTLNPAGDRRGLPSAIATCSA